MKNNMRIVLVVIFLSAFITFVSCGKQEAGWQIPKTNLKIKDADIVGMKIFKGFLLGSDFNRNEIYILLSQFRDSSYTIGIADMETENFTETFNVQKGNFQSPTDYFNPSYMRFLDNRYYIVDWFNKILVFDHEFAHLYTTMFRDVKIRYFFDFYKRNGDYFFVIGEKKTRPKEAICSIYIYKMIERRNLKLCTKIHETYT